MSYSSGTKTDSNSSVSADESSHSQNSQLQTPRRRRNTPQNFDAGRCTKTERIYCLFGCGKRLYRGDMDNHVNFMCERRFESQAFEAEFLSDELVALRHPMGKPKTEPEGCVRRETYEDEEAVKHKNQEMHKIIRMEFVEEWMKKLQIRRK